MALELKNGHEKNIWRGKMKRLEFLNQARTLAQQQCMDSSCLTDAEFKEIMESGDAEETVLYRKAWEILKDASLDMENVFEEVKEYE